ncbi:CRISPR subtype III-B-associated RAMP protein Cmr5 [Thermoanaerobacter kivui]|uniref:CRISPR type III-B/RAMP module-associated protein Cmr5 n=1 Tax=Thermoanaerobacter kivui TaxID=2325 RepID=A0A097AUL6_THEKI|nr:type III-B CRISPR module-associated protein Cmr5 [Thermoanaerobacter kivui]AIS53491.1 CRISPR subtype III-B-associated RAMP protein Cmr5 [Thermoanaerobacter kivui]
MRPSIAQERAKHALNEIRKINNDNGRYSSDNKNKYASYVESLPATILANGLGQAMATLLAQAKGDKEDLHYVLYNSIQSWLCRDHSQAPYRNAEDLMEAIVNSSRETYIQAQMEALAYLEWLKKFAVAFFKKETVVEKEETS